MKNRKSTRGGTFLLIFLESPARRLLPEIGKRVPPRLDAARVSWVIFREADPLLDYQFHSTEPGKHVSDGFGLRCLDGDPYVELRVLATFSHEGSGTAASRKLVSHGTRSTFRCAPYTPYVRTPSSQTYWLCSHHTKSN